MITNKQYSNKTKSYDWLTVHGLLEQILKVLKQLAMHIPKKQWIYVKIKNVISFTCYFLLNNSKEINIVLPD